MDKFDPVGAGIGLIGGAVLFQFGQMRGIGVLVFAVGVFFLFRGTRSFASLFHFRRMVQYDEAGVIWRIWIENDPAQRVIRAYCPDCDGEIIANPDKKAACSDCSKKFAMHDKFNKTKDDMITKAISAWHNRKKGYALDVEPMQFVRLGLIAVATPCAFYIFWKGGPRELAVYPPEAIPKEVAEKIRWDIKNDPKNCGLVPASSHLILGTGVATQEITNIYRQECAALVPAPVVERKTVATKSGPANSSKSVKKGSPTNHSLDRPAAQ